MRAVIAAFTCVLVLAGCSSDPKSPSDHQQSPNAAPVTPAQRRADRALLQVDDLPGEWSASDAAGSGTPVVFLNPFGRCLAAPAGLLGTPGMSRSTIAVGPVFATDNAPGPHVNEAIIASTSKRQDKLFERMHRPGAPACLGTAFNDLGHQTGLSSIRAKHSARLAFSSFGHDSVALRLTEDVDAGLSNEYLAYFDVVFAQVGDTAVMLTFACPNQPVARPIEIQVARSAVRHLVLTQAERT
jgi:hypothetical protein